MGKWEHDVHAWRADASALCDDTCEFFWAYSEGDLDEGLCKDFPGITSGYILGSGGGQRGILGIVDDF